MRFFLLCFVFILCVSFVCAEEVKFSTDQKEYYFLLGEHALINISVENEYGQEIIGYLTYTVSQNINQQGGFVSTTNSQTITFGVPVEEYTAVLDFGTSPSEGFLDVSLLFRYTVDRDEFVVMLNDIRVYFVSDSNEQNGQGQDGEDNKGDSGQQSSQSKQSSSQQSSENGGSSSEQAQQQSMTSQKVQNNQQSSDASALKNHLESQKNAQQELDDAFKQTLDSNDEFREIMENLESEGFMHESMSVNPTSASSGEFTSSLTHPDGREAEATGSLSEDGLDALVEKKFNEEYLRERLFEDKMFQMLEEELLSKGYEKVNDEVGLNTESVQEMRVSYVHNETGAEAQIEASFEKGVVEDVESFEEEKPTFLWGLLLLFLLLVFAFVHYVKAKNTDSNGIVFDYRKQTLVLLNDALLLCDKDVKLAYMQLAQSLRFYVMHKHGILAELNNDEALVYVSDSKVKKCIEICSLVEFAKYNADKKDFMKQYKVLKKFFDSDVPNSS